MAANKVRKDSDLDTFDLCSNFVDELSNANPRAKAIVAASALDEILARFLEMEINDTKISKRLVRRPYAPLGTFSARIDAAIGFGLISKKQHEVLSTIRVVRNHFAHNVNCTFSDNEIRDRCLALDLKHVAYPPGEEHNPEIRFLMNASAMCGQLDGIYRLWIERGDHPSKYLENY